MKQIGRTTQGKHLIEMTDHELRAFYMLVRVAQRKVGGGVYPSDVHLDTNLTETFTAVRLWIEQADTVNELQTAVDRMRKALGQKVCTCDPSKGEGCSDCP